MKFTKKTIYICLFAILYLIVAFSSLYHAVEFFGLANNIWMAIILAFAFEIGQAAVLFALLTSNKDRGKVMPWILMTMFTLVQVLGNVYSSYKHIINNSVDNLKYFKEPIFIWTQLPDDQATVIVTYLVGGLLPISALLLTSMVTNYLNDEQEVTLNNKNESDVQDVKINNETIYENNIKENNSDDTKDNEQNNNESIIIPKEDSDKEELIVNNTQQENENTNIENSNNDAEEFHEQESDMRESEPGVDDTISEGTGIEEITENEMVEEPVEENIQKKESHFVNLT